MARHDKTKLRTRLESLIDARVLPTRRSMGERRSKLSDVANEVLQGELEHATALSLEDASGEVGREHLAEPGVPVLVEVAEDAKEQIAGLTRAGFNFFVGTAEFENRDLDARRAVGGNGTVTRVFTAPETVLLETQRLVVAFEEGTTDADRSDVERRHGLLPLRELGFAEGLGQYFVEYPSRCLDVTLQLMDDDAVAYAEPDFIEYIGERSVPTDPLIGEQWHHAAISAPAVWPTLSGAGVNLTVVDTGFTTPHPDLAFDPAGSGCYVSSADSDDADFAAGLASIPNGNHGTQCAGMATATANDLGGVGVAHGATLRAVACIFENVGTQATLARALSYAADPSTEGDGVVPGADVIACSLGPNGAVWEMRNVLGDAIDFVNRAKGGDGVPLFWAVTNGNFPIEFDEVTSHPGVIAVGRSTKSDDQNSSGFGPELDFLAPGVQVLIPDQSGGYSTTTGTSFACPCAAGVAALMLEKDPTRTADEVRETLRATSAEVGTFPYVGGRNDRFGHGRIDAAAAVAAF